MICQFIDRYKVKYGVVPICNALEAKGITIAPRTYWAYCKRMPSSRELWDIAITEILRSIYDPDAKVKKPAESLYGSKKMWAYLNRQNIPVARCTIERLMKANGYRGVTRAGKVKTTVSDPNATRPPDLVKRNFIPNMPNELLVVDFTYVSLQARFAYVAFVIDAYANLIVGWECSTTKDTDFVERALRQAMFLRAHQGFQFNGNTIHHSDAGSQYRAVHYSETLMLNGLVASIGSVGDAYDNALAETVIGLYKTECIRIDSPFRSGPILTLADLEDLTSRWVGWYNNERLMHRIGLIPPRQAEAAYYSSLCYTESDDNSVIDTR